MSMDELMDLLRHPTVSVVEAGRAQGASKNTAYQMVRSGEMPVIRLGSKTRVTTAWLRQRLGLSPISS